VTISDVEFDTRVPALTAYLAGSFFPPLPWQLAEPVLTALDRANAQDDTPVEIPTDCPATPREAWFDEQQKHHYIRPLDLVYAVRLDHWLDDDEQPTDEA